MSDLGPTSVVVCDSSPDWLFLIDRCLRVAGGFDVLAQAAHPDDALALAAVHHPDVLLLDGEAPGLGLGDLLARVRSHTPGTRVVVTLLDARPALRRAVLEAGATAAIGKAIRLHDLVRQLRSALGAPPGTLAPSAVPG